MKKLIILFLLFTSSAVAEKTVYKCTGRGNKIFYNYDVEPKADKKFIKCTKKTTLTAEDRYNIKKVNAAKLLAKKDFDKAYGAYLKLLRENPTDDDIVLGLGISAEASKHNNQAVIAYDILQERYPEDEVIQSGLARNYKIMDDAQAIYSSSDKKSEPAAEKSEASEVAPKSEPAASKSEPEATPSKFEPAAIAAKIEQKKERTFFFNGNVSGGILYDSNANFGPDSEEFVLGNWLVFIPSAKQMDTFGAYFGTELGIQQRLAGKYWLIADAGGTIRENENDSLALTNNRANHSGRFAAGFRYLGNYMMADMKFKTEVFDYELVQRVVSSGLVASAVFLVNQNLYLGTVFSIDDKDYSNGGEKDASQTSIGANVRQFFNNKKLSITLGGTIIGSHDDSKYYDYGYDGWDLSMGLAVDKVWIFDVSTFAKISRLNYNSPATALETERRRDKAVTLGLSANYRIGKAWQITTMYSFTDNDSNSDLYKFDKHMIQLGTKYEF